MCVHVRYIVCTTKWGLCLHVHDVLNPQQTKSYEVRYSRALEPALTSSNTYLSAGACLSTANVLSRRDLQALEQLATYGKVSTT